MAVIRFDLASGAESELRSREYMRILQVETGGKFGKRVFVAELRFVADRSRNIWPNRSPARRLILGLRIEDRHHADHAKQK